jgi:hypothetical protein
MGVQACKAIGPVSLTRHDCRDGGRDPWVETHGYDPTWLRHDFFLGMAQGERALWLRSPFATGVGLFRAGIFCGGWVWDDGCATMQSERSVVADATRLP